jgi:tRNA G18 (ribose-2'-O)-methylase SpoU
MSDNIQLAHEHHQPSGLHFPLNIIAVDISSPQNVGSLFRLCDALGIEKLFLCGDTPTPPNTKINKTSRSTEKYVIYEQHENATKLVGSLKKTDAFIVSLEITSSSLAITSPAFDKALDNKKPVYLILGSENTGVDDSLLSLSDITVHIPMYGNNSSMNVISAASIACFEIIKNMQAEPAS